MELNQKQRNIIETTYPQVLVEASPAAGKTKTLTERARFLAKCGVDKQKIVIITFTRLAANEMADRLGEDGKGMFIGTVHSYATYLLLAGGFSEAKDYLENEEYDELFFLIKEHPEVIRPVEHLLLDEAQDSSEFQFKFILECIQPKNFMFFYDLKQTIYEFSDARPDILQNISRHPDIKIMTLDQNYRNTKEVFEFARWLIRPIAEDYSIIMREDKGCVDKAEYSSELVQRIGRTIPDNDYGNWFFLCRTNEQVRMIKSDLFRAEVPCESFQRGDFDTMAELNQKLKTNTIKVMTIHSAKGLEVDNVVVYGARYYTDEERRIAYVAATRARNRLWWLTQSKRKTTRSKSWIK